jgi:hypothetical protein
MRRMPADWSANRARELPQLRRDPSQQAHRRALAKAGTERVERRTLRAICLIQRKNSKNIDQVSDIIQKSWGMV